MQPLRLAVKGPQQAKGFWGRRKNVWTVAKNAVEKAHQYAYVGRKDKKAHFRQI